MSTREAQNQEPPIFVPTKSSLLNSAEEIKKKWKTLQSDLISNISPNAATFENTILPMVHLENETAILFQEAGLYASVSTDAEIRTAAREAEKILRVIDSDRFSREDLFARVEAVGKTVDEDSEEGRLLWKWARGYKSMGCGLGAQKERFAVVEKTLHERQNMFQRNLNEGLGDIWVAEAELEGLPESTTASLEVRDGMVKLPLKKPVYLAVAKFVHDGNARKKVFLASERACEVNERLFKELIVLRREYARLLGSEDYATLILESRMAKSPSRVEEFLSDLKQALTPIARKELENMKGLKREHLASMGKTYDGGFFLWDFYYYHEVSLQKSLRIDNQALSEYFPLEIALTGMLSIFSNLFSIQFTELESTTNSNPNNPQPLTWHPSVRIFAVSSSKAFIGHLYIDPYPRPGKYTHNACFNIHPGFETRQHSRQPVATALVLNLSAPSASKPALLQHSEVITLFHELGHGMHDMLSRTRFSAFHGYRVARDFVEMPGQMLENWCWMPSQLQKMGCHYSHLGEGYASAWREKTGMSKLPVREVPEGLVEGLARARKMNLALSTMRQLVFAEFDLWSHRDIGELDEEGLKKKSCEMRREIGLLDDEGEETCFYSIIPHLGVSSPCCYYGYLFSQVYSSDIFHSAFGENGGDEVVGKRYKEMVLEPGGSKDEMGIITAFLGRAPDVCSFWKEFGVEPSK